MKKIFFIFIVIVIGLTVFFNKVIMRPIELKERKLEEVEIKVPIGWKYNKSVKDEWQIFKFKTATKYLLVAKKIVGDEYQVNDYYKHIAPAEVKGKLNFYTKEDGLYGILKQGKGRKYLAIFKLNGTIYWIEFRVNSTIMMYKKVFDEILKSIEIQEQKVDVVSLENNLSKIEDEISPLFLQPDYILSIGVPGFIFLIFIIVLIAMSYSGKRPNMEEFKFESIIKEQGMVPLEASLVVEFPMLQLFSKKAGVKSRQMSKNISYAYVVLTHSRFVVFTNRKKIFEIKFAEKKKDYTIEKDKYIVFEVEKKKGYKFRYRLKLPELNKWLIWFS
jgi:hypothetical protein